MANVSVFSTARHYRPAAFSASRGTPLPARFGEPADEFRAVCAGAGLFDRSDRGLLILSGADRKNWLHNLVTNAVKTLDDDSGAYAFATDARARVQFDLNFLCLPGAVWLDIDRATIPAARSHLERYRITEDVAIMDACSVYARLGCAGPQAAALAGVLGVTDLPALPALASRRLDDAGTRLVRHDFAGRPGFELLVPLVQAAAWWDRLAAAGARPVGLETLNLLRIEAGIPWFPGDIDNTVLPPETGQAERGLSYQKGCYLGQEIIERMRSHGSQARRLVRLRLDRGPELGLPAEVRKAGAVVGRLTSLAPHPIEPCRLGLGYLRTSVTDLAGLTTGDPPQNLTILG